MHAPLSIQMNRKMKSNFLKNACNGRNKLTLVKWN